MTRQNLELEFRVYFKLQQTYSKIMKLKEAEPSQQWFQSTGEQLQQCIRYMYGYTCKLEHWQI